jgi:hypothetical protein
MRAALRLLVVCAACAAAAGCVAPTPDELEAVESARAQAVVLLKQFEEVVRSGDPAKLEPILSPQRTTRLKLLELQVVQANWLESYRGYELDAEKALAATDWQIWLNRRVRTTVPGYNIYGEVVQDKFEFLNIKDKWWISDFQLQRPEVGDVLDPPDSVKRELQPVAAQILEHLKTGGTIPIMYMLPKDAASRIRKPRATFWERLFSGGIPDFIPIFDDLETVEFLSVVKWPEPDELTYGYAEGDGIMAVYEVPYSWPDGGVTEPDIMRVEVVFLRRPEGWLLRTVYLVGEAFPWS